MERRNDVLILDCLNDSVEISDLPYSCADCSESLLTYCKRISWEYAPSGSSSNSECVPD